MREGRSRRGTSTAFQSPTATEGTEGEEGREEDRYLKWDTLSWGVEEAVYTAWSLKDVGVVLERRRAEMNQPWGQMWMSSGGNRALVSMRTRTPRWRATSVVMQCHRRPKERAKSRRAGRRSQGSVMTMTWALVSRRAERIASGFGTGGESGEGDGTAAPWRERTFQCTMEREWGAEWRERAAGKEGG